MAALSVVGCSSTEPGRFGSNAGASAGGSSGDVPSTPPPGGDDGGGLGDSGGQGFDGDESSGGSSGGAGDGSDTYGDAAENDAGGMVGNYPTCPASFPMGWIFCEDFEDEVELRDIFFEYQDGDGAFVRSSEQSASGLYAMRASYLEGFEGAGWLSVALGNNPAVLDPRPSYDPSESFEEIFWRVRVRLDEGWPNAGPHRFVRLMSVRDQDLSPAVVATLGSNGSAVTLLGQGSSCVVNDPDSPCERQEGGEPGESVDVLPGHVRLFSDAFVGQWHCVEGHVRLNTPGLDDGMFQYWVDGELDNAKDDLDWRGEWDAFGLNLLTVENFWTGGAPSDATRWIDDLVISTERVGCGPLGVSAATF